MRITEKPPEANKHSPVYNFFHDKEGKLVLAQAPNLPLYLAIASTVIQLMTRGRLADFAGLLFFGAIFTWAWLEIFSGVTPFRRVLGVVVMLWVLWSRF